MSSPKRTAAAGKAAAPVAKPAAKAVKAAPAKANGRTAASGSAAAKMAAGKTSSKDKAAFLKALAAGIAPDTKAARTVAKKSGSAPASALAKTPQPQQVEVLRRIPAPAAAVDTPASKEALALAASIDKALADGRIDVLQPHAQQALVAALVKLYAANAEAGERYAVLGQRTAVTATDVMITCGALLKAVDLQVFELGMWQSWSNG
jgi:hypothetical protein